MAQGLSSVDDSVAASLPQAVEFLENVLRFPSVEGCERDVQECIASAFSRIGLEVHFETIPDKIRQDAQFTQGRVGSFLGRFNLVAHRHGTGGGRSLIVNTHSDVVAAPDWPEAYSPRQNDGFMTGRGAVDAKGQIATIYLALLGLKHASAALSGDLHVQVAIDEEVGGNGTLSLVRSGYRADAAVVLEPTSLMLHPANRGALWFRFAVEGEAAHMARKAEVHSAVDCAMELVNILYRYEKDLLERARPNTLFAGHRNPVQVNVGRMRAGEWPSTTAARAVLEGGVGFLPDTTVAQVQAELAQRVDREASGWLRSHYTLEFAGLRNDAFQTPLDSPLVRRFQTALDDEGLDSTATGWIASCDARLFARIADMDTVVFGPGNLALAHSARERLDLSEMETAARVLARFIVDWCG